MLKAIRNWMWGYDIEAARAAQKVERKAAKDQERLYRDFCRQNGWPIPFSTDEFYEGHEGEMNARGD